MHEPAFGQPLSVPGQAASADPVSSARALPPIVVFSSLFPSQAQPMAGLFVRERAFRLRRSADLVVVSPQPWFPFQGVIRWFQPHYRPTSGPREVQDGVWVHFPRFLALPGMLRRWDALSMATCTWWLMRRLRRRHRAEVIDAHFAYPNGAAAVRLARWLGMRATITLRGTEVHHLQQPALRRQVLSAVLGADRVFSVAGSLRRHLGNFGVPASRIEVVGNGVDLSRFVRLDKAECRDRLGLPPGVPVMVSVGGLVDRKGYHRVIEQMPALLQRLPGLVYVIVGGPSPEGDIGPRLRAQVAALGLEGHVTFTGPMPPDALSVPLSAADLFVLPTANEGWANVFLEAMACGLPVVATDVGGNPEVIASPEVGTLVPLGDGEALRAAIESALSRTWDTELIMAYARENTWDRRIEQLERAFKSVCAHGRGH